jgi:hypothetical protein
MYAGLCYRGKAQLVTIQKQNLTLQQVFKQINRQTGLDFVYDMNMIKMAKKVDLHVKNADVMMY